MPSIIILIIIILIIMPSMRHMENTGLCLHLLEKWHKCWETKRIMGTPWVSFISVPEETLRRTVSLSFTSFTMTRFALRNFKRNARLWCYDWRVWLHVPWPAPGRGILCLLNNTTPIANPGGISARAPMPAAQFLRSAHGITCADRLRNADTTVKMQAGTLSILASQWWGARIPSRGSGISASCF